MNPNIPKRPKRQVNGAIDGENTLPLAAARAPSSTGVIDNHETGENEAGEAIEDQETARVEAIEQQQSELPTHLPVEAPPSRITIPRGKALIGIFLLAIVVFSALNAGYAQFIGSQGWALVLGGSSNANNSNPLDKVKQQLHHSPTPGVSATTTPITPAQYIDAIIQNMTLDQKLGQMMIVQFYGSSYLPDISTMINQYNVGAVLLFTANNNIINKTQLTGLISQMQHDSTHNGIPLGIAIDQEGGYVDRLVNLDGPRPSATSLGATNNPSKAQAEGVLDASNLTSYGFNLNLAPVVDVNTVYNPQLYGRTFGNNPDIVTRMAEAYLQGLQKSGKVFGTLKHFPGLGDVATDPHIGVADVYRSKSQLESIDWSPYRAMIQQGNVHSIMVTHDILHAIDASAPATLSYRVVTGILRDELGFQGVIITDSLTMEGITALYSESQAAAQAVEAGDDLLMGASTPQILASMIQGIKQAISSGAISMQRIDASVRRILTMKYELGLLTLPNN
ncbi:MAG TPA: glycoside hydrolase family 3 N-terminal domain-containing protein [Ktedonobacteraceae bacterium]|nr:glycoside hydrolase family 3 N-terminal domain-containing protein [Ktedonobacteraceae bacterium]